MSEPVLVKISCQPHLSTLLGLLSSSLSILPRIRLSLLWKVDLFWITGRPFSAKKGYGDELVTNRKTRPDGPMPRVSRASARPGGKAPKIVNNNLRCEAKRSHDHLRNLPEALNPSAFKQHKQDFHDAQCSNNSLTTNGSSSRKNEIEFKHRQHKLR